MTAMPATFSTKITPTIGASIPRNLRKRFYVVRQNNDGLQIVNLRHLTTDIAHTHKYIIGPFRTFADAVRQLEREAGVSAPPQF